MSYKSYPFDSGSSKDTDNRVRTQIPKLSCRADWAPYRRAIHADCYAKNALQCLNQSVEALLDWKSDKYLLAYPELAIKHAIPSEGLNAPTSDVDSKVASTTTEDKTSGSSTEQKASVKMEYPTTSGTSTMQGLAMDKDWRLHCLRMNKATYLTIYNSLHTNQHHLIQGIPLGDTFALWTTIQNFYQRKSLAARRVLMSSFWSMTGYMRSGSNLDLFVAHLEDLARRLNEMGEKVAASHILGSLLNGLPKEYEAIITVIDAEMPDLGDEIETLKFLEGTKDKLRDFAEKHKLTLEGPKRSIPRANAFYSTPSSVPGGEPCRNYASGRPCATTPCPFSHNGGRSQSRPQPFKKKDSSSNSKPARDKTADTCKNCGKKGHWARECKAPKKHAAHVARTSASQQHSAEEGVHWAFIAPLRHPVTTPEPDLFELVADVFDVIKQTSIEARRSPTHFGSEYSSDVTGDGPASSVFINACKPRRGQELDFWRGPLGEFLSTQGKTLRNDLGITHFGDCYWQLRASQLIPSQVWRDASTVFKRQKAKEYKIELLFLVRQLGPDFCLSDWFGPELAEGCLDRHPLYLLMDCDHLVQNHSHYGENGEVTDEDNRAYKFSSLLDQIRLEDGYHAFDTLIAIDAYFHGALNILLVADDFSRVLSTITHGAGPRASHVPVQSLVLYKSRYEMVSPDTLRLINIRPHGGSARLFGDCTFPSWIKNRQRLIPHLSGGHMVGPESYFAWTLGQLRRDNLRHNRVRKVLNFFNHGDVRINIKSSPHSMFWTLNEIGVMDLKHSGSGNNWFDFTLEEATKFSTDFDQLSLACRQDVHETVKSCEVRAANDIAEGQQLPLPQIFYDMLDEAVQPLPERSELDMKVDYSDSDSDDEPMQIKIEEIVWRCKVCGFDNEPPYADCVKCADAPPHLLMSRQHEAKMRRKMEMASMPGTCPSSTPAIYQSYF
jgi:hypothetical protein